MGKFIIEGVETKEILDLLKKLYGIEGHTQSNGVFTNQNIEIKDFISIQSELSLANKTDDIAKNLLDSLPEDQKKSYTKLPNDIPDEYKIFELNEKILIAQDDSEISNVLVGIVDYMKKKHKMQGCYILNINDDFITYVYLIKQLLLKQGKGIDELKKDVEIGRLNDILPDVLEPFEYLNIFLKLCPFAISLPFSKPGTTKWFFYSTEPIEFQYWLTKSYFSEYLHPINIATDNFNNILHAKSPLLEVQGDDIKSYIEIMINVVNRLLKYFLDISNFLKSDNFVDLLKIIQSLSTLKLIFADIGCLNSSILPHDLYTYGFASLDKIANLINHITGIEANSERNIFIHFFSKEFKSLLHSIFENELKSHNKTISKSFCNLLTGCYENISSAVAGADKIGDKMRMLRNFRHGATLKDRQFENLFINSNIKVPCSLSVLPFLIMLAIALDSKTFFQKTNWKL